MDHHHLAREKQISSGNVEREKRARGARSRRTRGVPALCITSHLWTRSLRGIAHHLGNEETERENVNPGAGRTREEDPPSPRGRRCSQSAVFYDPPRHRVSSRCSSVRACSRDVTHVVLSHDARTHARILRTTRLLGLDHLSKLDEIRRARFVSPERDDP